MNLIKFIRKIFNFYKSEYLKKQFRRADDDMRLWIADYYLLRNKYFEAFSFANVVLLGGNKEAKRICDYARSNLTDDDIKKASQLYLSYIRKNNKQT